MKKLHGYLFTWSNSWTSVDGWKNFVTYFCIIILTISESFNESIRTWDHRSIWSFVIQYTVFIQNPPLYSYRRHFFTFLEQKCRSICLCDAEFSWSLCFSFYGIEARNITLDNWYYSIFFVLIIKSMLVEE